MIEQVRHAVRAVRFLVGDRGDDQGAGRSEAVGGQAATGDGHRRREIEHVDGAASPHDAVVHVGFEGIVPPATAVGGNHVGVAEQQQRGRAPITTVDPGDETHAAGRGRVAFHGEPDAGEVCFERVGAADLVPRRVGAVVDAGVADQRAQQLDDFGGHRVLGSHETSGRRMTPARRAL